MPTEMPTDGKTLTWGVLGTGTVARLAMLPALSHVPNARVLAVASASRQRAEALAGQFGVPHAYGDYAALLDDSDITCVYIALPNHLHMEWVLRALHAGKHVLCEKPLGAATPEVEAMHEAADTSRLTLMEALMYRFHPRTARIHALLTEGAIGEPQSVSAAFSFTLADPANYRWRPELGGGALLDVGGYCVSVALAILGNTPTSVQAVAHYGETGIDESASAMLAFAEGRTAQITCGFRAAEHQRVTVIGTTGVLDVPLAFTAWHNDPAPLLLTRDGTTESLAIAPADPYELMARRFTEAVLRGEPAPYPLADSLAVARVVDAIRDAARQGARAASGRF